jgi:uncharacterized membrane protein YccC
LTRMAAYLDRQYHRLIPAIKWPRTVGALLREGLASTSRKYWVSLRLSTIGTIGVGLIAVCHVNSDLGSYLVWLVVGAGPMMAVERAASILAVEGLMLASSVVAARTLAETPWLMLPFIFAFMAASTFIIVTRKFGPSGLLMQVVSLGSLYGVVFAPGEIGWTAAANFGASALAFGLLVLFDNWLWPDRAEPILIDLLGANAAKHRRRLAGAAQFYLDAHAVPPPEPPPTSDLPQYLALLDRAVAEGLSAHRRAVLLAAVTRMTRIQMEIDRLIIAAREAVRRQIRMMMRAEIENAVNAIAAALDEFAQDRASLMRCGADEPPSAAATRARLMVDALTARIIQVRPLYIQRVGGAEVANFAYFANCLENLTQLLERSLDEPPATFTHRTRPAPQLPDMHDPMPLQYSLKVGICSVAGYVIGLAAQRPEFSVILTTIVITALPTYGASLRKMILRIVGSALGGLVSLLLIIIVTPNFETLPAYLLAIFIVLYISAYSSLGGERIAYAGKQIGTAVLLVFAGLSPSTEIYGPLWRIWGILLGTFVVTVIFFLLWPEYAGDSLLPRLRQVIRDAIALAPRGPGAGSKAAIETASSETMHLLKEILEVADDARLEGRKSLLNHDAVVQAAGILRRIANRLAGISMGRLAVQLPPFDPETEGARTAVIRAVRERLEWWLAQFETPQRFRPSGPIAFPAQGARNEIALPLDNYSRRLEAQGFARINSWTIEQRRTILSELQSLHRLKFLMAELDRYLSAVGRLPARPLATAAMSRR